jgi:hypothetical protein
MRFTEHEMTVALTGAAKVVAAQGGGLRRRKSDPEEAWQALGKYERYQILAGLGDQLLPVFMALPDVEVPAGTRATFTNEQIEEAIASSLGDSGGGRMKRRVVEASRILLVKLALDNLPIRRDPDALTNVDPDEIVIPDDLSGL